MLTRWVGPGAILAGVAWLGIWGHQQLAHGQTSDNEMRLVAGLTWMDTSKLVVLPLGAVLAALVILLRDRLRAGPAGAGGYLAIGGLGLVIVLTIIEFWPFPWGSYAVRFEDAEGLFASNLAGGLQAIASLLFAAGLLLAGIDLVRAGRLRWWEAAVLVLGAFFTVYLSPVFLFPAVAWVALGLVLIRRKA